MTAIPHRRRTLRKRLLLALGWVTAIVSGLLSPVAMVMLLVAMAPSDPSGPGATDSAPGILWHLGWGMGLGAIGAVGWALTGILFVASVPRFSVPTTWPPAPSGWQPGRGWVPPAVWPEPPPDWSFWV